MRFNVRPPGGAEDAGRPPAAGPLPLEWRWLRHALRPVATHQALSLACILSASLLALVDPLVMKWLIDEVLPKRQWRLVPLAALGLFAVFVGRWVLHGIGGLITLAGSQRLTLHLRRRLLEHLQTLPPAFYESTSVGELLQRVERDVDHVGELGADVIPAIVRMAAVATFVVAAMLALNWQLTSAVLPLVPPFLYLRHRYRAALSQASERVRDAAGRQTSLLVSGTAHRCRAGTAARRRAADRPAVPQADGGNDEGHYRGQARGDSIHDRVDDHRRRRHGAGARVRARSGRS